MPGFNTIVLPDAVDPELDELELEPVKLQGGIATYTEFSQSVPSLRDFLTVSLQQPTKTSRLYKARVKYTQINEKMDNTDPVNPVGTGTVDHVNSADIIFIFDEKSTAVTRKAIKQRMFDLLRVNGGGVSDIDDVISDLRPIY